MADELLRFVLQANADGVVEGFGDATKASETLEKSYTELTEAEKKAIARAEELAKKQAEQAEAARKQAEAEKQRIKASKEAAEAEARVQRAAVTLLEAMSQQKGRSVELTDARKKLSMTELDLVDIDRQLADANKEVAIATQDAADKAKTYADVQGQVKDKLNETQDAALDQTKAIVQGTAYFATAKAMLDKFNAALDQTTAAYIENRNALVGLESIVKNQGHSYTEAKGEIESYIADGLIPLADASTALKNLLSRGFSIEESIDMLNRFKDSAAFGRQESLGLGEAVRTATEGIKNENSILVDNAGVTKNVSVMWKEYAAELGVGVQTLTLAQKRQAEYNGIMRETRHQVGDAAKYAAEYSGAQAAAQAETTRLKVAIGEANTQGLRPMMTLMTALTKSTADYAENNKEVLAGTIAFVRTLLTFVAVGSAASVVIMVLRKETGKAIPIIGMLQKQFAALWATITGPVGLVAGALAIVVGVFTSMQQAADNARQRVAELNDEISSLSTDNAGAQALVDEYEALSKKQSKSADEITRMREISRDLVETYEMKAELVDIEGNGLVKNLDTMKEQLDVQRQLLVEKYKERDESLKPDYEKAVRNLDELRKKEAQYTAEIQNRASKIDELSKSFGGDEDSSTFQSLAQTHQAEKALAEQRLAETQAQLENFTQVIQDKIQNDILLAKAEVTGTMSEIPMALMESLQESMTEAALAGEDFDLHAIIGRFYEIDSESILESVIPEINAIKEAMITAFAESDEDTSDAASIVDNVLKYVADDSALTQAYEAAQALRAKIDEGVATPSEKQDYDRIRQDIARMTSDLGRDLKAHQANLEIDIDVDPALSALKSLRDGVSMTAAEIEKAAIDQKVSAMSMNDFISEMDGAAGALDNMTREMNKLYDLQAAIAIVDAGAESSIYYADALGYLSEQYGISEEAVLSNLDAMAADAEMSAVLMDLKITLATTEAMAAQATIIAMEEQGRVTAEQSASMIANLDGVIAKLAELAGTRVELQDTGSGSEIVVTGGTGKTPSWTGGSYKPSWTPAPKKKASGRKSGSSAASQKNTALERELKLIDRKRSLDQLTTQEEISALLRVRTLYAKTADERAQIDDKVYALRKQKRQADFDHAKAMDRLTVAEQIKTLNQMAAQYKKGTEQRLELERQVYELQKQQSQEAFDDDVYYGRLTLAEQITRLNKMAANYKKGTETRKELERQIFDLERQQRTQLLELDIYYGRLTLEQQRERIKKEIALHKKGTQERIELEKQLHETLQQIRDRDVQSIDRLTDGITQAIAARYRAQQDVETAQIHESITNWQTWAKEQQAAINEQIKALDEQSQAEDRAETERQKRRDIAAAEQMLLYETDAYTRRKLEEEIAKKQDELTKWLQRNEREDLKAALQEQSNAVSEIANAEQQALEERLDATNAYYDDITRDSKIRAEAEKTLMASTQKDILELLSTYLPDYDLLGQSMGERLVDGFRSKVGNIGAWVATLDSAASAQQTAAAQAAINAASLYWQQRDVYAPPSGASDPGAGGASLPPIVINFNQPVNSPAEFRRELERILGDLSQ